MNMNKFNFLLNKEKYKNIIKYIFIGSLFEFQKSKIIIYQNSLKYIE